MKDFHKLPHFTGKSWQGGSDFPDGKLGWAQLTATGGHPGNDLQHAVIRRWVAPTNMTISVRGELKHEPEAGDGVRAFVVSSQRGELKSVTVHHATEQIMVDAFEVTPGESVDFIVSIHQSLNSNQFLWAPEIVSSKTWDAKKDFAGPAPDYVEPLQPWAQYAQALLLSNEFSFID